MLWSESRSFDFHNLKFVDLFHDSESDQILWMIHVFKQHESESESHSVMSNSLWPHGVYSPWNSPDQNTWVDSLSLLQGIFPTQGRSQGLNPSFPYCRRVLYQLSYQIIFCSFFFFSCSARPYIKSVHLL